MRKINRNKFLDKMNIEVRDEFGRSIPVLYDFYEGHIAFDYRLYFEDTFNILKKYLDDNGVKYIEKTFYAKETEEYKGLTEFPVIIIANSNFRDSELFTDDIRVGFKEEQ